MIKEEMWRDYEELNELSNEFHSKVYEYINVYGLDDKTKQILIGKKMWLEMILEKN
ncbi:hypothetical protein [Priestia filamentosa]|uniref:hypothetical protein n=1 Tax=Priestia filamentosa TaxID=1402861 RepID=UPI000AB9F493|nr:hypothetical protein [Priestia filamentosa]